MSAAPAPHALRAAALLALASLLLLAAPAPRAAHVEGLVKQPFLELHTGPGGGYPVFHTLDRGEEFEILARRTDWFRIRGSRDHVGWVSLADLDRASRPDGSALPIGSPGSDEYFARRFESAIQLGDFGGGDVIGLRLGWQFTPNLAVELVGNDINGRFSDGWRVGAGLIHQPFPDWRVSPFVSLGGGLIATSPEATLAETEDRLDQVATVGLGLRMHLTRNFLLRAEYENHLIITDRNDNEDVSQWTAGFAFFF